MHLCNNSTVYYVIMLGVRVVGTSNPHLNSLVLEGDDVIEQSMTCFRVIWLNMQHIKIKVQTRSVNSLLPENVLIIMSYNNVFRLFL